MCPKQSCGLVGLHMTSYANALTYCWSRSPPLNVFVLEDCVGDCCVKFMLFFFFATGSYEPVFMPTTYISVGC